MSILPSLLTLPSSGIVSDTPASAPDTTETSPPAVIPLNGLMSRLDSAIRAAAGIASDGVWITAEVRKVSTRHGAWFVELADEGARKAASARLAVRIAMHVIDELAHSAGIAVAPEMIDGQTVRMRVQLRLHPRHHLSAQALAIDPAMTPSLQAAAERKLRQELQDLGLCGLQRSLPVPHDIHHVAIVHPDGSAVRGDVDAVLSPLIERRQLIVDTHAIRFEGPDAARNLVQALENIVGQGWRPRADLVLIVRGGGSAAGMADIETLEVAEKIARLPMPVVLGIGHAPDDGILSTVAWMACPTPTAAAIAVRDMIVERATKAHDNARTVAGIARRHIGGQEAACADAAGDLRRATFRILSEQTRHLTAHEHRIGIAAARLDEQLLTADAAITRMVDELRSRITGTDSFFSGQFANLSGLAGILRQRGGVLAATAERDMFRHAAERMLIHASRAPNDRVFVSDAAGNAVTSAATARGRPLTLRFPDGDVAVMSCQSTSAQMTGTA